MRVSKNCKTLEILVGAETLLRVEIERNIILLFHKLPIHLDLKKKTNKQMVIKNDSYTR